MLPIKTLSGITAASTIVLACGIVIGVFRAQSQPSAVQSVFTPFTAQIRLQRYAPGNASTGSPENERTETFTRRSDGSFVRTFTFAAPDGAILTGTEMVDLRKSRTVTLEPSTGLAIVFVYPEQELRARILATETCTANLSGLPPEATRSQADIGGKKVIATREANEMATIEKWIDSQIDCYPLQSRETSPRGSVNERTVVKLEQGEPSDSIFEIPAGYVVATPAQVEAAYQARYPGKSLFGSDRIKTIEERHRKNRHQSVKP